LPRMYFSSSLVRETFIRSINHVTPSYVKV